MPNQPFRPPNEKDLVQLANGEAKFRGVIRSTGTAVDNSTTVAPAPAFFFVPASMPPTNTDNSPGNLAGTLAAKMLLLQPTAAGHVRASSLPLNSAGTVTTVGTFTLPVPLNTEPGVKLQTEERVVTTMLATDGWLQWISTTGTADLLVWELV